MSVEPKVEQLGLPPGYGNPKRRLDWDSVRKELEDAPQYWVASTRPDGRPHVVPRDGVWLDDTWYYGGSPDTVHNLNIETNTSVVMHIGDGMKAIIVEGEARHETLDRSTAQRLADASNTKYAHYGMNNTAETYMSSGTLALKARRVLAWTNLPEDATRFLFSKTR
jgi:Pyridoxamine 5'-phosphate oxidase